MALFVTPAAADRSLWLQRRMLRRIESVTARSSLNKLDSPPCSAAERALAAHRLFRPACSAAPGRIAEDDVGREVAERGSGGERVAADRRELRRVDRAAVNPEHPGEVGEAAGVQLGQQLDSQGVGQQMLAQARLDLAAP